MAMPAECTKTGATTAQIQALPVEKLEALADALLDFQAPTPQWCPHPRTGGASPPSRQAPQPDQPLSLLPPTRPCSHQAPHGCNPSFKGAATFSRASARSE